MPVSASTSSSATKRGGAVVVDQRRAEAEIEVARQLAREDRAALAHLRLDEGMADATHAGRAAGCRDRLGGGAARAQVVEHEAPAAVAADLRAREQARDQVGADRLAVLVDEHGAIAVAVEGDTELRAAALHRGDQIVEVLALQRIGFVIRKGAVGLEVETFDLERQPGQQPLEPHRRHAVAAVDRDPQRRATAADRAARAARSRRARRRCAREPRGAARGAGRRGGELLDLLQTRVAAHRNGVLAADLEPVVARRDCATR